MVYAVIHSFSLHCPNRYACYRDVEAVAAGAVPVLDGYRSGGKNLFGDDFPAIHIPECSK